MVDAFVGALIGLVVVVVVCAVIASQIIYVVHQAEGIVVERLGKFNRVLDPGWNVVLPLIEAPRAFSWRKTHIENGRIKDDQVTLRRVDLREAVFNFLPQEVYTRDTVMLRVNCVMYYSVADVRKAIYEVDDLTTAVSNTAQTQLKEVFGGMAFTEALCSQELINSHMARNFASTFEAWGLKVERIELQDMTPLGRTSTAMKAQMVAERNRRAEFIKAEGGKAAMRLRSEGDKMEKINMGVAEQEATRKRSEGTATAQVELARAEKASLDAVADAIRADGCSQTAFMLAQRYNDMFRSMAGAASASGSIQVYLPYDISGLSGLIADLPSKFGRRAPKPPARPVSSGGGRGGRAAAGGLADEFADLN